MLSLPLYSRGWKQGWDEAAGTAPIHPSRESSLLFTETWAYRVRFQGTLICKEGLRALETASDGSFSRDRRLWLGHCLAHASVLLPRPWLPHLHKGGVDLVCPVSGPRTDPAIGGCLALSKVLPFPHLLVLSQLWFGPPAIPTVSSTNSKLTNGFRICVKPAKL